MKHHLTAKLSGDQPQLWRELASIRPENGNPGWLFECTGMYYHLSTQGALSKISDAGANLALADTLLVCEQVDCVRQWRDRLYIASKGQGILVVDLATGQQLQQHWCCVR